MKKFVLVPFDEIDRYKNIRENIIESLDKEKILAVIPKNVIHKAKSILDHISDSNAMSWNEKGEIIIDGECIENSHITDLVKSSLYAYKNLNPIGYNQFHATLLKSNIPRSLIQQGSGFNSQSLPPPGIPSKKSSKKSMSHSSNKQWVWHYV